VYFSLSIHHTGDDLLSALLGLTRMLVIGHSIRQEEQQWEQRALNEHT